LTNSDVLTNIIWPTRLPPIFNSSWSQNVVYDSYNEMMMTFYNLIMEQLRNTLACGY